jgi:DNA-directed RNA polymerase subunit H (RpoH/RPB5)
MVIPALGGFENDQNATIIIVFMNKLTPTAKTEFEQLLPKINATIEFWTFIELLVCPFDHYLVPKHSIMTEKEIDRVFPREPIRSSVFASMPTFSHDIVVKWLGGKPKEIIKIEGTNLVIGGPLTTYRIVKTIRGLPQ